MGTPLTKNLYRLERRWLVAVVLIIPSRVISFHLLLLWWKWVEAMRWILLLSTKTTMRADSLLEELVPLTAPFSSLGQRTPIFTREYCSFPLAFGIACVAITWTCCCLFSLFFCRKYFIETFKYGDDFYVDRDNCSPTYPSLNHRAPQFYAGSCRSIHGW